MLAPGEGSIAIETRGLNIPDFPRPHLVAAKLKAKTERGRIFFESCHTILAFFRKQVTMQSKMKDIRWSMK
jgi:hypothetical protein